MTATKPKVSVEITMANFTYEKNPGEMSDRQVLVLTQPDDTLLGVEIDGNDLTSVQPMIDYLAELELAKHKLREKYNLKDLPYKRFKKDKIRNIIESNIKVR